MEGGSEAHYNILYTFAMTLLMDFNNYINSENYNMQEDRVGFRSFPLYLSDAECDVFLNELKASLIKVSDNKPNSERRLRKFSFTIMPKEEKGGN